MKKRVKSKRKSRKPIKKSKFKSISRRKSNKRKKSMRKSRRKSRRKSIKKSNDKKSKLKLLKIVKSPIKTKKYRAYFNDGSHTDFGAKGYQNYGGVGKERHLDEERKKRYIERHKRNENWKNPKSAGSLSRYVLWNKKTLKASIADYKKRFKL
jgi:hypothetical protein